MNRENDKKRNYFDELPRAYYDAIYSKGKFYDLESKEEIVLEDNALVRIAVKRKDVVDRDYERHVEISHEILCKKENLLFFNLSHDNNKFIFEVKLHEDLYIGRKGNSQGRLNSCECEIIEMRVNGYKEELDEPLKADSLNQLVTLASVKFRPGNKSHTTNVFKSFTLENGISLEQKRPF